MVYTVVSLPLLHEVFPYHPLTTQTTDHASANLSWHFFFQVCESSARMAIVSRFAVWWFCQVAPNNNDGGSEDENSSDAANGGSGHYPRVQPEYPKSPPREELEDSEEVGQRK